MLLRASDRSWLMSLKTLEPKQGEEDSTGQSQPPNPSDLGRGEVDPARSPQKEGQPWAFKVQPGLTPANCPDDSLPLCSPSFSLFSKLLCCSYLRAPVCTPSQLRLTIRATSSEKPSLTTSVCLKRPSLCVCGLSSPRIS